MKAILVLLAIISAIIAGIGGFPELSYSEKVFLGYLGTFYMFAFLIAYSGRKRIKKLRKKAWLLPGRAMKDSLELHIFTGLLGPGIIILHSSLSFNGLPGVSAMLMIIVVMSGITGRYIFNRVRKLEMMLKKNNTGEGNGNGKAALTSLERMRKLLGKWRTVHIPLTTLFFITVVLHILSVYYY
jgi:hypothetical protein